MRIEKAKVPLAELRVIVGKTQAEMAALLGVSLPAIQSIESKRMRVSEKLAGRVFMETGADWTWVRRRITGKQNPPIDNLGRAYSKEIFARHRAHRDALPTGEQLGQDAASHVGIMAAKISSVMVGAGPQRYLLCRFKLHAALDELAREFGTDRASMNALLSAAQDGKILTDTAVATITKSALSK